MVQTRDRRPTTRRTYLTVVMLAGAYSLSFLDRQLLSILAEPIRTELNLSDTQLGLLSGVTFAIFYGAFGIPVAWLADRTNRVRIVVIACALWSVFTSLCGLAQSFTHLALARVGVGVGEAGGSPPSYSIIADHFPAEKRGGALALYSLGVPFGTTAGAAIGGWIAAHHGWRMAFVSIGVFGICYAALMLIVVREPIRGDYDDTSVIPIALKDTLRRFASDATLRFAAMGAGLSAFVGYAMLSWTPAVLMRSKGMTLEELSLYYSLVSGACATVGTLLSGQLVDWLGRRDPRMYGLVPAAAFLFSMPFYALGIVVDSWRPALFFLSVPFSFYAAYLPPTLAVVQNRMAPAQRSAASSILVLFISVVGLGGGPVYIGMISDAATEAGYRTPLQIAMLGLTPVFLLAGVCHLGTARALTRTRTPDAPPLS